MATCRNVSELFSTECKFSMEELRHQREVLMIRRLDLIERHKKLTNRILLKPFLASAKAPTPVPEEKLHTYDSSWVKSILTELVFDAVREVEVSRPYKEKVKFYTAISRDYDQLVDDFVSKSIKTSIVSQMFEQIWKDATHKEMIYIVKQCIGDINIAESLASTLVLASITRVSYLQNPELHVDNIIPQNLMTEISMDRMKRKTDRHYHKLVLTPKNVGSSGAPGATAVASVDRAPQQTPTLVNTHPLSATRLFDIQSLEERYLPPRFGDYLQQELALWKNMEVGTIDLHRSAVISLLTTSPSLRYVAVVSKGHLHIYRSSGLKLLASGVLGLQNGDCIHLSWKTNEQEVITTMSSGSILFWRIFERLGISVGTKTETSKKRRKSIHKDEMEHSALILSWKIESADLAIVDGPFASNSESTPAVLPLQTYPAPIFTVTGDQPVLVIVADTFEIFRLCKDVQESTLFANDIPEFQEIKNTTASGMKLDICRGHQSKVLNIVFKDEYSFFSIDETCHIIEWEYSRTCFDAYGYVIPTSYIVRGNDLGYARLVKGQQPLFNTKGHKTRQEAFQHSKAAEDTFSSIGYGRKPAGTRKNVETGLVEKTFVRSVTESYELEVAGTVLVNQSIGKALVAMTNRIFKLKNFRPSKFLGVAVSPCETVMAYCYLFTDLQYNVQPYISILLLCVKNLTFLRNKIKVPLTEDAARKLHENPEKFTACLSPPHCFTRACYLIIKVDTSVLVVSTATSSIVRTSLDLLDISADTTHFISDTHVSLLQGSTISCCLIGPYLAVYGDHSKQLLTLKIAPSDSSDGDERAGALLHGKCAAVQASSCSIDPECRRLLVKSQLSWGKVNSCAFQVQSNFRYLKSVIWDTVCLKLGEGPSSVDLLTSN